MDTQPDRFCCDKTFNVLFLLESIIKITKDACLEKEINSQYYNLQDSSKTELSQERNTYINMLSIALDKVAILKEHGNNIEKELYELKQYTNYCSR